VRTILVVSLLAAIAGCKDKPTKTQPPPNAGSAIAGSGSGQRAAPDLVLPHADGTPPKRTTKPHAKSDYERLARLEYPGFLAEVRTVGDKVFEVRQKTKDHPRLWAVVTIKHCFECLPMDLAKWKAKEQELKTINLEGLKDSKDVDWELGETQLNGQKIIYTYQVGTGQSSKDTEGGGGFTFTNAVYAYFNDGINEIRVVGTYKDDPAMKGELVKLAPKEDLRTLALAFMDVYTHAW
jgi:hypothetical protein